MSRVIKFRVWGIRQNAYLGTDDGANYWLYPTYEECRQREEGRGVGFRPLGWCLKEPERFVVEQFTGLLDKNGREIYEGDIVAMHLPDEPYWRDEAKQDWNAKVEYEADRGGYILTFREHGLRQPYVDATCDTTYDCIVIGNIHLNPDLLES